MTEDNNSDNNFSLLGLIKHRSLFWLMVVVLLFGLFFVFYSLIQIASIDVFPWSRYTSFGPTNYYRARSFNFYAWPAFGLLVMLIHLGLAYKNFKNNRLKIALIILILAVISLVTAFLTFSRIISLPR